MANYQNQLWKDIVKNHRLDLIKSCEVTTGNLSDSSKFAVKIIKADIHFFKVGGRDEIHMITRTAFGDYRLHSDNKKVPGVSNWILQRLFYRVEKLQEQRNGIIYNKYINELT